MPECAASERMPSEPVERPTVTFIPVSSTAAPTEVRATRFFSASAGELSLGAAAPMGPSSWPVSSGGTHSFTRAGAARSEGPRYRRAAAT